jgi:hypothetical protein
MIFVRHKISIHFLASLAFSNMRSKLHNTFKGSKPPWLDCEPLAFVVRIAKVDLRQHLKCTYLWTERVLLSGHRGVTNTTMMGRTNMAVQHDTERRGREAGHHMHVVPVPQNRRPTFSNSAWKIRLPRHEIAH